LLQPVSLPEEPSMAFPRESWLNKIYPPKIKIIPHDTTRGPHPANSANQKEEKTSGAKF
jgi:hypothetical protein